MAPRDSSQHSFSQSTRTPLAPLHQQGARAVADSRCDGETRPFGFQSRLPAACCGCGMQMISRRPSMACEGAMHTRQASGGGASEAGADTHRIHRRGESPRTATPSRRVESLCACTQTNQPINHSMHAVPSQSSHNTPLLRSKGSDALGASDRLTFTPISHGPTIDPTGHSLGVDPPGRGYCKQGQAGYPPGQSIDRSHPNPAPWRTTRRPGSYWRR